MKFATRISSIRRIAWNALRSCSDDSLVTCADSDGELRAQRVDPLAARLEDRGHRVLGQPVDLEVGMELAQLVGDRDVALGVAEPDGRRDVQRAAPPVERPRPGGRSWRHRRSRGSAELHEVADEQVGEHRVAARDHVVGALDDARAARRSARRVAGPVPAAGSVSSVPWTRSIGQATARQTASTASAVDVERRVVSRRASPRRRSSERPAGRVLDRLRRVRLGA